MAALVAVPSLTLLGCGDDADQDVADEVQEPVEDVGGQQDGTGGDQAGGDEQAFADPESFLGQEILLSGEVTETVGPQGFRIKEVAGAGEAEAAEDTTLLVVGADAPVEVGEVVQVEGRLERFDREQAAQELGVELPQDPYADFNGDFAILAATVTAQ